MLNFSSKIKKPFSVLSVVCMVLSSLAPIGTARAQDNLLKKQPSTEATNETFAYFATARLLSPDRKVELTAPEVRVDLKGTTSVTLRGRGIKVNLESEHNHFRKTQMLKITANNDGTRVGNDAAALNAGMFRLTPQEENSFLYTDKSKGWVVEVRLRPTLPKRNQPMYQEPKSKSPVRRVPRKPRRMPA